MLKTTNIGSGAKIIEGYQHAHGVVDFFLSIA
jgi:hypothetical protein